MRIEILLSVPRDARDSAWHASFNGMLCTAPLFAITEEAVHGPDGFPYFIYSTVEVGDKRSQFAELLSKAMLSACGVVILNVANGTPECVLSHGDVVACKNFGASDVTLGYVSQFDAFAGAVISLSCGSLIGLPTERFLPASSLRGMAKIAKAYGILAPRINAFFEPSIGLHVAVNLCDAAKLNKSDAAMRAALSQLAWFVPRCYQLCVEPAGVPASFHPSAAPDSDA